MTEKDDEQPGIMTRISSMVKLHGHMVINAEFKLARKQDGKTHGESSYTIGLCNNDLPEIIVMGLGDKSAAEYLNVLANIAKEGGIELNKPLEFIIPGRLAYFKEVNPKHIEDYLPFASLYGGKDIKAIQFFWADEMNRFPWEPRYRNKYKLVQPNLS